MFFFNLTAPVTLCQGCIFQDFFALALAYKQACFSSPGLCLLWRHTHTSSTIIQVVVNLHWI